MCVLKHFENEHRAVADIIATLLMVAITVVGGILIFVFAQGFFADSGIVAPSVESVQIFGYDASDSVDIFSHTGETLTAAGGTINQKLSDGEAIGIYVRNAGGSDIIVQRIDVFGTEYTFVSTATTPIGATSPTSGKYGITTSGGATGQASQIVSAGAEATIVIAIEADNNGEPKVGRPIPVKLTTGNGAVFTKQVKNGILIS